MTGVTNGSEEGKFWIETMVAGTARQRMSIAGAETIFNEDSVDLDFRVESNGNANMLFVNGGSNLVGIGADPDLGAGLHIKIADSGATATAHGDELVIEDGTSGANVGISILCNANGEGRINFGDSDDNDIGMIRYDHADNKMHFVQNNASQFTISGSTSVTTLAIVDDEIASGGETAPDVGTGGLCLNQGGSDNKILTFKSTGDVAHGITTNSETDTYAEFKKNHATSGGLKMLGYSSGESALQLDAQYTTGNSTKGTGATCPLQLNIRKKSGTGTGSPASNENMFSVTNNGQTKFIVDAEGDIHNDGSVTAYDNYEDAQLVRAFDLSHGKGVIDSKFDKFISYNHEALADMKLVGREEDGTPNHFINVTGMQRLHNGAIWQQYEKHQKLASAFYKLATKTIGKEEADKLLTEEEIQLLN